MSIQPTPSGGAVERGQQGSLADVVGTILDKGIVVDVFARVSLVGIELLRVDARIVIASVDTYLRFAEAANRLEMGSQEPAGLPEVVGQITGGGSKKDGQQERDDQDGSGRPALESGGREELRSEDRRGQGQRQPARRQEQEEEERR